MKRFLLFLFGGLLIAAALNLISDASPVPERQVYQAMLAHADTIEALTIGTSMSAAVDFDTFGLRGWHMWTPSSDLLENDYLLRAALPSLPRLRVVLIAIPPVAFQWLNTARGSPQVRREQYRTVGPRILGGTIDGDWPDLLVTWALPLVRDDQWRDPMAAALAQAGLPVETPSSLMASKGQWLPLLKREDPAVLRATAETAAPTVFEVPLATISADPDAPRRLEEAVRRMAKLLAAHGVRAIFYTPPVAREYEAVFDQHRPRQVTDARDEMRRIAATSGLTYIDLSRDPALLREVDGFFYDPIHLTVEGAVRFTRRLRQELATRDAASAQKAPFVTPR